MDEPEENESDSEDTSTYQLPHPTLLERLKNEHILSSSDPFHQLSKAIQTKDADRMQLILYAPPLTPPELCYPGRPLPQSHPPVLTPSVAAEDTAMSLDAEEGMPWPSHVHDEDMAID